VPVVFQSFHEKEIITMNSATMRAVGLGALLVVSGGVAKRPVAVHLAGDSTAAAKRPEKRPEAGWGEALPAHFSERRVRVVNHAMNGRSTRTFIEEGRWQALVDSLRPGDWVLVQFGHNDGSKDKVDRYTPPDDYRRNLERFVAAVRARRAHPVLMTPVRRRRFDAAGTLVDTHGEYPELVRAVATEQGVPLLDLHARTAELLTAWGPDSSRRLFLQLPAGAHANYPAGIEDNTHFSPLGATLVAELVVGELRRRAPRLGRLASRKADSTRAFVRKSHNIGVTKP
jgi:lysophospholipase L1-like esterase